MGGKMKNVLSKRRPRQNIIATILKNAKSKGTSSSRGNTSFNTTSTGASSSTRGASKPRGGYSGSKRGLLQSAVELTRRSKDVGSRSRRSKSKGRSRSIAFVKGQRAFYRSPKGISKVTVVGIHHDAKLEAYYTIRMRDGKEKQTDGKHLTPIREDAKSSNMRSGSDASVGGGSVSVNENVEGIKSSAMTGPDVPTDHMTESSSEVEVIIEEDGNENEVWPGNGRHDGGMDADNEGGFSDNEGEGQKFEVDQDAYIRYPEGSIAKVRILSYGEDPNHPTRYAVSLPDGSRKDNVKQSRLATLMDLTSKELSMLMKERNKKHGSSGRGRSRTTRGRHHTHPKSPAPKEDTPDDTANIDEGYLAAEEGGPTFLGSGPSLPQLSNAPAPAPGEEAAAPFLALPQSTTVKMVEAKTEDGGTKMVPMYEAGRQVRYKNAAGIVRAEILDAHLDDLLEPYYTVRLADGREKQTDNAHILVLESEEEYNKGLEEEKGEEQNEVGQEGEKKSAGESGGTDEQEQESKRRLKNSLRRHSIQSTASAELESKNDVESSEQSAEVLSSAKREEATSESVVSSSVPHAKFTTGDPVLYKNSQGEQLRAVVLRLHRDKKGRPYYVVRLKNGKEKQVYSHRLRPYVREDRPDGGSRSRSRVPGERGGRERSSSKASKSDRYGQNPKRLHRSESAESHRSDRSKRSALSNSSRRSAASLSNSSRRSARSAASRDRSERVAAEREGSVPASSRKASTRRGRRRDESISSSYREGRGESAGAASGRRARSPSIKRGRSHSALRRVKSVVDRRRGESSQRPKRRERSRSRNPSELSSSYKSATPHHHHSITNGSRSRPGPMGVSASSRALNTGGGEESLLSGEGEEARSKGRSISRLKNFRKSFAGRKKKHG